MDRPDFDILRAAIGRYAPVPGTPAAFLAATGRDFAAHTLRALAPVPGTPFLRAAVVRYAHYPGPPPIGASLLCCAGLYTNPSRHYRT